MRVRTSIVALGLLALCGLYASGAGREAVPLNDYTRLGQRFTATQPFDRLSVIVPSWMDAEGGLTLTLWESPQRGRQLAQQVLTAIPDNAEVELLLPRALPPGTYYWEVNERTGQTRVGLYADGLDTDTADCAHLDGVPDPRRRFLFSTPQPPFAYTDPAQMIAVLASAAPLAERQEACRLLAAMGRREAIPVLAQLLSDAPLAHMARYALESMPDPAVDAAFRDALVTLTGTLRVGVINSIAVRRDAKAVRPLSTCLSDPDAAVAAAAAAALGRIGTATAAKALEKALTRSPDRRRPALWEGCLEGATQLAASGHLRQARALYDTLRRQETTAAVRAAAERGALVTRGAAGVALLCDQLRSADPVAVSVALWVVQHELPGAAVTQALGAALPELPEEGQVALAQALCSRTDPAALPVLLELARNAGKPVRLAAIQGLPRVAGATATAVLLDLLADPDDEISMAALNVLSEWPGQEPDRALAARLDSTTGKQRLMAIQLVGARRLSVAVPSLLQAARDPDPAVRLAALRVLGDLAGADDIPVLLEILARAIPSEESEALERALRTACGKATNPDACADMLARLLPQAQPGVRQTVLRLLHGVGGSTSCQTVLAATTDSDADVCATAFRLLGEWRTPDALPHLLRLAETSAHPTGQRLCLRGCIRLAGSTELPAEQRLDLCRRLVPLVQRDEEKKLFLGVLAGLPVAEAIPLTRPYLDDPATRAEAGVAILAIAAPLLQGPAAAQAGEALRAVVQSSPNTDPARRAEALLSKGKDSPAGK